MHVLVHMFVVCVCVCMCVRVCARVRLCATCARVHRKILIRKTWNKRAKKKKFIDIDITLFYLYAGRA